ncbi:MAG: hypothetical protein MZV70_03775 [Desulfobacterales bacterium]|nr:hypothetical protein [Desulfobacterales bacterium]
MRDLKEIIDRARPNDGHKGLARLETMGILKTVITQNIDGLHQVAGNTDVIEFHGTFAWQRCMQCETRVATQQGRRLGAAAALRLRRDPAPRRRFFRRDDSAGRPVAVPGDRLPLRRDAGGRHLGHRPAGGEHADHRQAGRGRRHRDQPGAHALDRRHQQLPHSRARPATS